MPFEYGEQRDANGNITHEGSWGTGSTPKESFIKIIENFRALKDDGIMTTDWPKVLNKPTTLTGYGITDAAPKANPTLTGKVGISSADSTYTATSTSGILELSNTSASEGAVANFLFRTAEGYGNVRASISAQKDGTGNVYGGKLNLSTRNASNIMNTIMTITGAGKVGIGTTSPQGELDMGVATAGRSIVWGGTTGINHYASIGTMQGSAGVALVRGLKLSATSDQLLSSQSGSSPKAGIIFGRLNGDISFFNQASSVIPVGTVFDHAANTKMIIKENGNIGIGTTSPTVALDVVGAIRATDTVGSSFAPRFKLPNVGATVSYVKIAELTTNIGSSGNGLILYLNGLSNYGNNIPGADILQCSTRGTVDLIIYTLMPSGSANTTYGYVNNTVSGKTEIWLRRTSYTTQTEIIVAQANAVTYGALLTQTTEPDNIVYVTKKQIATTDSSITGNAATASKIKDRLVKKPATDSPSTWEQGLYYAEVYNNGYPTAYGNLLNMKHTTECTQLLLGWAGADKTPVPMYIRNKRDSGVDEFSDWSQVYTSHTANPSFTGNLSIGTTTPTVTSGYGGISLNGTAGGIVNFQTDNVRTSYITGTVNALSLVTLTDIPIIFSVNSAQRFTVTSTAFRPTTDNAYTLGLSNYRFQQIYAATATISTSDKNAKTDIADTTLGLDFIKSLRPVEYKYKVRQNEVTLEQDGTEMVEIEPERTEVRIITPAVYETVLIESEELDEDGTIVKEAVTEQKLIQDEVTEETITPAVTEERPIYREVVTPLPGIRSHVGLIAQEVENALGGKDIGLLTKDWETGQYGLRYEEFIAPLIKAVQELSAKVDQQATEIAILKQGGDGGDYLAR